MIFAPVGALVLAAGKGTRMYSESPKVLQHILNEPMLRYVFDALPSIVAERIWTVIGHKADEVVSAFPGREKNWILQDRQLGTGHALQVAWETVAASKIEYLLVVNGDTPLVPSSLLASFVRECVMHETDLGFMTLTLPDPGAYGRVVRRNGKVHAIVEAKDFREAQHGPEPKEINAGVYCFRVNTVGSLLSKLCNENASSEYYITDLIALAVSENLAVEGFNQGDVPELLGINTPGDLVRSEELMRSKIVASFLKKGVIIRQPDTVRIGPDVILDPGVDITGPCELYGRIHIMAGTRIESHCFVQTAIVGRNCHIRSFCHIVESHIAADCNLGPYARLRPATVLEPHVHIGNFVEIKKSRVGEYSKINHLSYVGDAEVGKRVNVGAGAITCNYDGSKKHVTVINDDVFIGSNSALVAPVSIGENSLVGAGSVITRDVDVQTVVVARAKQTVLRQQRKS